MVGHKTCPENFTWWSERVPWSKVLLSCSGPRVRVSGLLGGCVCACVGRVSPLQHHCFDGCCNVHTQTCASHKRQPSKHWTLCRWGLSWFHLHFYSQSAAGCSGSHNLAHLLHRICTGSCCKRLKSLYLLIANPVQWWFLFCSRVLGAFLLVMTSVPEIAYISHKGMLLLNLAWTE